MLAELASRAGKRRRVTFWDIHPRLVAIAGEMAALRRAADDAKRAFEFADISKEECRRRLDHCYERYRQLTDETLELRRQIGDLPRAPLPKAQLRAPRRRFWAFLRRR